jgi:hypothetical protein
MTDRTERQKRDEATKARDELTAAPEEAPPDAEQETLALSEVAPERAAKPRRASRKNATSKQTRASKSPNVDPEAARAIQAAERASAITELESQGFSADEALRLIDISKRLENSTEAREARRLRFTRWLVEQGILNEFSA